MAGETEGLTRGAAEEGGGAGDTAPAPDTGESGSVSGVSLDKMELSDDVRVAVEAARKADKESLRAEYEGPEGHIARAKSERDKAKNKLARQETRERQELMQQQHQLRALAESDPEKALQLSLQQNEQLLAQTARQGQRQGASTWVTGMMADMGFDLEDGATAALAEAKVTELMDGLSQPQPVDMTYDVQQSLARELASNKDERIATLAKENKTLKEDVEGMVADAVTKALAGKVPAPDGSLPGGSVPGEAWRDKPAGQLIREGLAARRAAAPTKE